MVILVYCYCSRGRLTDQGTNLGKVYNAHLLYEAKKVGLREEGSEERDTLQVIAWVDTTPAQGTGATMPP